MTDHVSRETPPVPAEVRGAFSAEVVAGLERYVGWLADAGVVRGLIGPREAPRLWERHVLNCLALVDVLPPSATVADLGSGAGLPGLVVAIARPDLQVTLVEPLLRRTTFLEEVVADLSLDRVDVVRGRAEALHGDRTFDVVTSRALAGLDKLLPWSMPLVAPRGALVAMKGDRASEEIALIEPQRVAWGVAPPEVLTVGRAPSTATLVRVTWADPSRVSWPLAQSGPVSPSKPRAGGRRPKRFR